MKEDFSSRVARCVEEVRLTPSIKAVRLVNYLER
jgi:hypothetical protein